MGKIYTVTFQNAKNYGAVLQAFALQKFLLDNDFETEILNYQNDVLKEDTKIIKFFDLNYGVKFFIKNFTYQIIYFNKKIKKINNFNKFEKEHMRLTKKVKNIAEIEFNINDIFICGSDQVWNTYITKELSDIYTLNFGNDKIKRISYAASVGDITLIDKNQKEYIKKISKLDHISVREENAKNKFNEILNKEVNCVLDPTFLINSKEWKKLLKKEKNEDYILVYALEGNEELINIVNNLSEKTGLSVVYFGLKNPGYKNVLHCAYSSGPLEFLEYINNAKYVIASSFHAAVFSIIFNKNFYVIPHSKTGARVINLLNTFELSDRCCYSYDDFKNKNLSKFIDWEKINNKIIEERINSSNWLFKSIGE